MLFGHMYVKDYGEHCLAQQHPQENLVRQDGARRAERAQRILDAAAGLILRWGYNKTTIDDIARQAGVAKGTIYLHWKTREALFAALMQRERVALAEDVKQRIADDPAGATLHGLLKQSTLALMQRPLLKAVLLRDIDIVGKLAHNEASSGIRERAMAFQTYLEVLREHGLVRTDLGLREQVFMVSAIFMGFLLLAPLMPDDFALPDEEIADLLAEAVRRTFAPRHDQATDQVQVAAQAVTDYLERDIAIAQQYLQQGSAS